MRRGLLRSMVGVLVPVGNIIQYNKFDNNLTADIGLTPTATNISYDSGKVNQAIDTRTGNPSLVNFTDSDLYSFTDGVGNDLPFSFSMWLFISEYTGTFGNILSKQTSSDVKEYDLQMTGDGGIWWRIAKNGSGNNYIRCSDLAPGTLPLNEWFHLVATYNGSKLNTGLKLYKNKVSFGSNTNLGTYTEMTKTTAPLRLGVINNNALNFRGLIDEFAIFNKELNENEILTIYNKGAAGLPLI